ncbi:MAG: hypothetical protein M3008_07660, partial [Chloroflexota bacterium]|nr:hypothetical protein [Chloroflexota bacterium]
MATYAELSRRRFLVGALGAGGLGALVACGSQVGQLEGAPYATNTTRNAAAPPANRVAASGSGATPAASGSAAADPMNMAPSVGTTSAPAATVTPAKDWQAMNQHHEAGIKTFLAQPKTVRGGQRMEYTMQDGIKVFDLAAKKVQWEVTPGQKLEAYTYNGVVPGPEIRVTHGDKDRIR